MPNKIVYHHADAEAVCQDPNHEELTVSLNRDGTYDVMSASSIHTPSITRLEMKQLFDLCDNPPVKPGTVYIRANGTQVRVLGIGPRRTAYVCLKDGEVFAKVHDVFHQHHTLPGDDDDV